MTRQTKAPFAMALLLVSSPGTCGQQEWVAGVDHREPKDETLASRFLLDRRAD